MATKKYYVVWAGHNPGVYDDWEDAKEQIINFPNASYKGFASAGEAAAAYRKGIRREDSRQLGALLTKTKSHVELHSRSADILENPAIDPYAWAVDAACSGNPGPMEYRCVELISGKEIFHIGPLQDATNNIGEFLAIVHALALMYKNNEWHNIYSDSVSGMAWVRNRRVKTQLQPTPRNNKVFQLLARAIQWLNTHQYQCRIMKWDTKAWGEIPADFGRKS